MEEKQLIKQIEQLKEIKPDKEWVILTKRRILESGKKEVDSFWSRLFTPATRPALVFAFRGIAVAAIVLAGVLFYMFYLNSHTPQITLFKMPDVLLFQNKEDQKLLTSLESIQESLKNINLSLNNLKNIKDQKQALAASEVIKETTNRASETLEKMKQNSKASKSILASLVEVKDAFKELSQKSDEIQKQMVKTALDDLEQRRLGQEDKVRLSKAKDYFEKGEISNAIILIVKIMERP